MGIEGEEDVTTVAFWTDVAPIVAIVVVGFAVVLVVVVFAFVVSVVAIEESLDCMALIKSDRFP